MNLFAAFENLQEDLLMLSPLLRRSAIGPPGSVSSAVAPCKFWKLNGTSSEKHAIDIVPDFGRKVHKRERFEGFLLWLRGILQME